MKMNINIQIILTVYNSETAIYFYEHTAQTASTLHCMIMCDFYFFVLQIHTHMWKKRC